MRYKNLLPFLFLIILSFIPLVDLFHPGLPITHDGQDHVARIANFYKDLEEGSLVPRWAANLNWGYGHPILMFLYPIPSYAASLFHFFGFSFIDSVKIVFGLMFVLSGITMYLWAKNVFDSAIGFLVALLYMFTPYRFVDLYVRGAIGEHVAFVFPPLVLYFLLKLSKKYSPWFIVGGGFSLAGLILSHNAISLMFFPIILFYSFYLIWMSKSRKEMIINNLVLIILGFGLAAFFWMPAFFEGKYTLRNIVTKGEYLTRFIDPRNLFYGLWNYGGSGEFTVQLGIINIFAFLSSFALLFYSYRRKNKAFIFLLGIIIYSLLTVVIMLPQSNFIWSRFLILQNFQFPWRFLSVLVFTTSVLAGFVIKVFPGKVQKVLVILLFFFVLLLNRNYWHANGYLNQKENFYTNIYNGTTDTGESAPIWSIRFMLERPKNHMEVISGQAKIKEVKRTSTEHKYTINADNDVRIRENTLYFPGWRVFVDGKKTDIEFQDQKNRGLITFYAPKGEHNIEILFQQTKLRILSSFISVFSLGIIGLILIFSKRKLFSK